MNHALLLLLCLGCLFVGCAGDRVENAAPSPEYHTEGLEGILERGYLRVIVQEDHHPHLPRGEDPVLHERDLARAFAARHSIAARFVTLDTFATLLPALEAGLGDVVIANLTVTPDRQDSFRFTAPLEQSFEVLVLAAGAEVPAAPEEVSGRLGVAAGTSFESTAWQLAALNPRLEIVVWDAALDFEDTLDSVARGRVDFTIEDSIRMDVALGWRDDVLVGPRVSTQRPLAWAVRRSNPRLLEALDDFLHEERLLGDGSESYVEDLEGLRERRRLRMITRNNGANYFLWRGQIMGFEYELAHKFAEEQGLRLEVVVAPTNDDLMPMLLAGEGDFVAAFITRTPERVDSGLAFSRPYHFASEIVVGRSAEVPMESVADLAGREIAVRHSSSYWSTLERLRAESGVEFSVVEAPSTMETEDIIAAVGDSTWDLTLADSHLLELEMTARDDLQGLLVVGDPVAHGWVVHPQNTELLAEIDAFFARHYRDLFYNVVYEKYFERPVRYKSGWEDSRSVTQLSPWDDLVRELAADHSYDWRLIVAQMYQESRFDPEARSWAGALGLMQVLPRTAREFGMGDLTDPRVGIEAGLLYLDWVWERFPDVADPAERMWFTLAAYNAGHGHVRDARRLARRLGLDPDLWFAHVEVAMLKLSQAAYAKQARHGFVRGREPVEYVREIRSRYRAYVDLLDSSVGGR